MAKLSITTLGTYEHWNCVFKYECRWYMSGAWTVIKVDNYWTVTLIDDDPERITNSDDFDFRYEPDVFEDERDNYHHHIDTDFEEDMDGGRYEIKTVKLDENTLQKIEKIIGDNIKTLATMWWLEQEPLVEDWCYSRIFLWGKNISIEADISNLWEYHWRIRYEEDDTKFYGYNPVKDKDGIAENLTNLMDVFFKIRDILIENWIDEEYFDY